MIDELTDQLRRYGDALEEHLVSSHPATVVPMPTHPRRRRLLAVAAVAIVLGVGVGVGVVAGDDDKTLPVSTHEGDVTSTTTTVVDDTTVVGDTTPTTEGSPSITTVAESPTTTTTAPVGESHVRGSVDWPGRDTRGELYVAACPSNDTGPACPSMRVTPVADDGTFDLSLPPVPEGTWRVAAYVDVQHVPWQQCVFSCVWATRPLNVVRGEVIEVDANVDQTLALSVSARVVDVFVRDSNDQPFQGPRDAGVQVTDARCAGDPCPEDQVPMFMQASPPDSATRLVVNPDVRYVFHGQAMNMGWPNPPYTQNGDEFWFSPDEVMFGSQLDEGHVFHVDGAPAESSSP